MLIGRLFIPVWVCGITMGIASAQDARVLTVENIVQSSTGRLEARRDRPVAGSR